MPTLQTIRAPLALMTAALILTSCGGSTPETPPQAQPQPALDRSVPPQPGAAPAVPIPPVQRHRLSNGLEVLIVEQPELPVVDVELVVRAGAGADPVALAGRASLTADLLDEGTASFSPVQLADSIEALGATLSTAAGWDASRVRLHVLAPRLRPALGLLGDVVRNPTFAAEEVDRKRTQTLNAILQQRDEARAVATNAFHAVVYGTQHPFGIPLSGTTQTVEKLDRAALLDFYRTWYRPNNAFLVVVGDVHAATLLPQLEAALGGWQAAQVPAMRLPEPPQPAATAIYLIDKPGAAQSEVRIGQLGVARNTPDYFALTVMNTVLGGAFTSRLNTRLREERGYSYGAASRFDMRATPGPFLAASAVFTQVTDSALAVFMREFRELRENPVPADELARAKNYLALGLPARLETTGDVAAFISDLTLYGVPLEFIGSFVERVQAVTAADVQRVAQRYLDASRLAVVITGDRAKIEPTLKPLGIGPVQILEIQ